jgi:hypothetical protein
VTCALLPSRFGKAPGVTASRLSGWPGEPPSASSEPRIWAAIEAVAQALLHAPLQDGERALSGECVKAIMREAGVEPGALRQAFLLAARQRAARETAKPHAGLRCWRHGGRWSILFPPPPPTAATESKSPALKAPAVALAVFTIFAVIVPDNAPVICCLRVDLRRPNRRVGFRNISRPA